MMDQNHHFLNDNLSLNLPLNHKLIHLLHNHLLFLISVFTLPPHQHRVHHSFYYNYYLQIHYIYEGIKMYTNTNTNATSSIYSVTTITNCYNTTITIHTTCNIPNVTIHITCTIHFVTTMFVIWSIHSCRAIVCLLYLTIMIHKTPTSTSTLKHIYKIKTNIYLNYVRLHLKANKTNSKNTKNDANIQNVEK